MLLTRVAALRAIALAAALASTSAAAGAAAPPATILDVLAAQRDTATVLAAIRSSGLEAELHDASSVTIFAPNDAAFAALPAARRESLMRPAGRDDLRKLLLGHVVRADIRLFDNQNDAMDLAFGSEAGTELAVHVAGSSAKVNGAKIVRPDLRAENGEVQIIDRVL